MDGLEAVPFEKTYGYHRAEIRVAVCNAVELLLLACWILYEAFTRFYHPSDVLGLPVMLVGIVGLAVNLVCLKLLAGGREASINIRSAYLEILSDAITSIGVVLGGGIIWMTDWYPIDPLLSVLITLFIVWRTWLLLSQAVNVLMEGVPPHLNAEEVANAMIEVAGVREVHELHIWSITSGRDALSAHIIVSAGKNRDSVLVDVQHMFPERFLIDHITLQMMEQRVEWIQPDKN